MINTIGEDNPYSKEEKLEGLYLKDRDCDVVDVKVPIKFCPYCGRELDPLGGLRSLF